MHLQSPPDIPFSEASFTELIQRELSPHLTLSLVSELPTLETLSAQELAIYREIRSPLRQASWLLGRSALKRLLGSLGEAPETSELTFPHPRLSLTHSGDLAMAVGNSCPQANGLGVDYEAWRPVHPKTGRFFLSPRELEALAALPGGLEEKALLRLWTVKEAVFKAHLANVGSVLRHYEIEALPEVLCNALLWHGLAKTNVSGKARFEFLSIRLKTGYLTLALNTQGPETL